ncbi:MAG: carbohydrate-binding protein, partial [Phycisphaerae bacterium]
PATYLVDVPNGQYRVIIHSATGKYGQMNLGISAEGEEVERFWYVDPYTRDAAVFDVAVTDGQLTLDLAADYGIAAGSWKWSGLEIVRMGTQIDSSPVLSGSPHGPQAYADGSGPMAVAPDLTLTDDGTSLIQGATVRIHDGLLTSQDVLHATTVGNISAVYDASAGVLTISGADSAAHYQAVLRSVTYESTAAVAGGGMREVTFRLNDGQTHSNLLAAYVLPTGAGTKTIVDDFESYSAGDLLDGSGHWSAENNADIVADPAEAGNLAGHVWDRTTDARNTSPDLLVADGEKASLFFRACIVDPGAGGNFGLAVSGSDTVSAGTLMESSDVKIGPAGGPTQFEPIDGVWYRMWIEIDNADDTQTLYIQSDGDFKYATRTQIGSRSFNGGSAGDLADFVAKFKNHPDAMHVYLDDLQVISEGPATVAEPVVNVIASDSLAAEQDPVDKGTWTFSRSGDTTDPLTVHYTVDSVPDAGEYNTDTPLTGSVTIPAGSVFATIDLTAVDDDRVEDFEVVTLALAADPAYNIGSKPLAMVGIVDDEIPATVDVMTSDPDAGEAGPNPGEFTFTRTGPTTYDLQVTYEVSGSAEPGDYSADPLLSGTITIPAGSDSASVTVTPVDDMLEEGYEELRLSLVYGGPEYVIGPSGDAVLVIVDDEQPIDYLLIDDFESYQIGDPINDYDYWTGSDGDAAVEIDPADAANQALHSFNRHEDVINQHPSLRVFDGQTATLFYRMYADQLSQPTASIGMHVGQKDYTLAASTDINNTGVEGRAIQTGVWYNVWMVLDHGNNVVDLYMQSDSDPGFAAQQKVAENIAFKTSNWSDPQALSSFNIHHFNNPDTTSLRVDDIYFAAGDASLVNPLAPDAVLVSIQATDPEAAEDGSDTGAFTVTRTGDTTDPLTVDYTVGGTATDDDYTASPTLDGSITIAAGSSTATIVITATPDSEPELDETIEIALSAGTDYGMAWPSAAAVSIIDDDGPAQVPYGAGPWQVTDGLRLEAEDFDTMTEGSGEGLAYHDTDSGNNGGQYRDTGVDIGNSGDTDGGYSIGWIDNNEWLEYTVDVTGGSYDIHARVASADGNPGDLRLVLGGTPLGGDGQVLGTFPVEDTGGWQNWVTLTLPGVTLSDGQEQILRLEMDGELFNVNWIEFEAISPPTVTQVVRDGGTGSPDELNQLAFAFNKDVSASLTASDLAVYNDTSDQPVDNSAVTMTWDAGSNTATFDVSPLGLTAGYYTFTLAATDVTDEGGNPLDGDGDGTGGDDFSTQLLVAPAGDANTDGKVSLADLSSLAGNWDSTTATWEEGDFNGDGKVSLGDLSALAGNWNANVQATPVDATESDAQLQTTSAPTAEVEQQPSTSTVSVLDEVQAVPVAPATTLEASPTPGDSTIATDLALQGSPTPAESIEPDMAYLLRPAETDGDGETEGGALLEIPLGE